MKRYSLKSAITQALDIAMEQDEKVFCIGEDIGVLGGSFGVTAGFLDKYGPNRVIDTPISEGMIVGAAVGAAAAGMVPIVEIMFADFVSYAFDQVINQAAKMRYMYGGNIEIPLVIRMPGGGGVQAAAQHSQNLEAFFTHIPGLKVVMPSTPGDARGLMLSAIRDRNPVIFFETKSLYARVEKLKEEFEPIPLGVGDIKRTGKDVTLVATGPSVRKALAAADILAAENIDVEVIDPRTLYPLDEDMIYKSVEKTGRLVIVTEECKRGAWSGELAAMVAENRFDDLKKKIVRIGALNTPVPLARQLEEYHLPQEADIVNAVKSVIA
ncbi:MAG TPA: alpha-ketoacid dehydrogenase subunit beta [Syntrophomonas sp.]|nr:alpha-ketoacid dehydrogenase subunit beta [Syntrophomonas sp.]